MGQMGPGFQAEMPKTTVDFQHPLNKDPSALHNTFAQAIPNGIVDINGFQNPFATKSGANPNTPFFHNNAFIGVSQVQGEIVDLGTQLQIMATMSEKDSPVAMQLLNFVFGVQGVSENTRGFKSTAIRYTPPNPVEVGEHGIGPEGVFSFEQQTWTISRIALGFKSSLPASMQTPAGAYLDEIRLGYMAVSFAEALLAKCIFTAFRVKNQFPHPQNYSQNNRLYGDYYCYLQMLNSISKARIPIVQNLIEYYNVHGQLERIGEVDTVLIPKPLILEMKNKASFADVMALAIANRDNPDSPSNDVNAITRQLGTIVVPIGIRVSAEANAPNILDTIIPITGYITTRHELNPGRRLLSVGFFSNAVNRMAHISREQGSRWIVDRYFNDKKFLATFKVEDYKNYGIDLTDDTEYPFAVVSTKYENLKELTEILDEDDGGYGEDDDGNNNYNNEDDDEYGDDDNSDLLDSRQRKYLKLSDKAKAILDSVHALNDQYNDYPDDSSPKVAPVKFVSDIPKAFLTTETVDILSKFIIPCVQDCSSKLSVAISTISSTISSMVSSFNKSEFMKIIKNDNSAKHLLDFIKSFGEVPVGVDDDEDALIKKTIKTSQFLFCSHGFFEKYTNSFEDSSAPVRLACTVFKDEVTKLINKFGGAFNYNFDFMSANGRETVISFIWTVIFMQNFSPISIDETDAADEGVEQIDEASKIFELFNQNDGDEEENNMNIGINDKLYEEFLKQLGGVANATIRGCAIDAFAGRIQSQKKPINIGSFSSPQSNQPSSSPQYYNMNKSSSGSFSSPDTGNLKKSDSFSNSSFSTSGKKTKGGITNLGKSDAEKKNNIKEIIKESIFAYLNAYCNVVLDQGKHNFTKNASKFRKSFEDDASKKGHSIEEQINVLKLGIIEYYSIDGINKVNSSISSGRKIYLTKTRWALIIDQIIAAVTKMTSGYASHNGAYFDSRKLHFYGLSASFQTIIDGPELFFSVVGGSKLVLIPHYFNDPNVSISIDANMSDDLFNKSDQKLKISYFKKVMGKKYRKNVHNSRRTYIFFKTGATKNVALSRDYKNVVLPSSLIRLRSRLHEMDRHHPMVGDVPKLTQFFYYCTLLNEKGYMNLSKCGATPFFENFFWFVEFQGNSIIGLRSSGVGFQGSVDANASRSQGSILSYFGNNFGTRLTVDPVHLTQRFDVNANVGVAEGSGPVIIFNGVRFTSFCGGDYPQLSTSLQTCGFFSATTGSSNGGIYPQLSPIDGDVKHQNNFKCLVNPRNATNYYLHNGEWLNNCAPMSGNMFAPIFAKSYGVPPTELDQTLALKPKNGLINHTSNAGQGNYTCNFVAYEATTERVFIESNGSRSVERLEVDIVFPPDQCVDGCLGKRIGGDIFGLNSGGFEVTVKK